MHLTLDRFLGKHVPVIHPWIAWLVEHSAFVRLTGVVGRDGRTAYNNIRGTEHTLRLPIFGERLRYKVELPVRAFDGVMASLLGSIVGPINTLCLMPSMAFARRGQS